MSVIDSPPAIAEAPTESVPGPRDHAAAMLYDGFISYSHAKDKALASALQSAMQRLGKPWYRRRALRMFRDDTSLSASPELWGSIEQALGQSRFLILIASPEAAASPWVDKEVAHWLEHNGLSTLLIALTDGELVWNDAAADFHWSETTPLPPSLRGRFASEPFWIDLRPHRDNANPRDAKFADLAADFAATIHGRPKEDLLSQELRQQRRALRLALSAIAALVLFLALAGWQWTVARAQRNRAEHNLALATETANGLVFSLAQKFRTAAGVPAAVIADILSRAQKLQSQLSAGGETAPDLRRSQAAALDQTADTPLTIGDTKGALAVAIQARDIVQALLAADPGNTDYQHGLSIADDWVGRVLAVQGDLAGALAAYRDGLVVTKALVQKDPGNTDWQRGLSVSDNKIGDMLEAQGDLGGALAAYRDGLAIMNALAQKEPGNTQWQHDLSMSDEEIGSAQYAQGDFPGALQSYRAKHEIISRLAQKDPGNTEWQRDLAVSDEMIGNTLHEQGDLTGALAAYRDCLAIIMILAQRDPGNAEWQRDLALSDGKIADVLRKQGDLPGALAAYRDGLAITKVLVQKDPDNTQWQRDLLRGDQLIGVVLEAQGDLVGALGAYRDGLAIAKALANKAPGNVEWQRDVWFCDDRIGNVLKAQGDLPGALGAYREGLGIAKAVVRKDPSNVVWQTNLALSLEKVAESGDDSRANLTEALAILQRLDVSGKLTPDQKGWIANIEAALKKAS
jgi:tetratricopeptide (TPR) repeat protein